MTKEEFPGIRDPPKPTCFKYPDGPKIKGTVVKEVRKKKKGRVSGEYCFVIQSIKYPNNEDLVRFAYYYRKKPDAEKFNWVRNAPQAPVYFIRELIKKAEKEDIL